jgi:hypothetical protein
MPQALTTAPVAAVLATVVAVVVEVLVLATRFSVVNAAEGTSAAFLTPLEQRVMSQTAASTLAIAMMAIAKEVALAALVPVLFLPLQSMHRQNLTKQQQPQTTMRLGGGPKTLRPT